MTAIDAFQLDLLHKLVAAKTVYPPGNEAAAARILQDVLADIGFATTLDEIQPGRANLVATLRGGPGPEIALSGHLDVVAADADHWQSDPFTLRLDGGRAYGRGVCDMKGAISSMVAAARDLVRSGAARRGAVSLIFVVDEEVNALGSRHYARSGGRPDAVIIGEPTNMDVCVAHRGCVRYHLDIAGQAGHASKPDKCVNPINIAARLTWVIETANKGLASLKHPLLPSPTMAVTMISAGEQPNVIPGTCRITVDRRVLPGENEESIRREVKTLVGTLAPEEAARVSEPLFFVSVGASEQLPGSGLADECRGILAGMGLEPKTKPFTAACDHFVFIDAGVDCLLVGPGDIAQAHTADEYVELEQLALARDFYLAFLRKRLVDKT